MSVQKFWNLDSPKMCRDFLKEARFGENGAKINFLQTKDGREVTIDDASDEQVLQVANDIAEALGSRGPKQ